MNTDLMFSSKTDEWETPQDLYDELNEEFGFELDPCCTEQNHKCRFYITKEQNGLKADWGGYITYCNPPYGKTISEWVRKAYETQKRHGIINIKHLLLCFFRREQIQNGFTIIYTIMKMQKSDLSRAD